MRIALAVTLGDFPVEPEVEANTRRFAEALRVARRVVTRSSTSRHSTQSFLAAVTANCFWRPYPSQS